MRCARGATGGSAISPISRMTVAADLGAAGVALNPLHALFRTGRDAGSPYSPNSRLFLNVLYIDVAAIPEFPGSPRRAWPMRARAAARDANLIDYPGVAAAKLPVCARPTRLSGECAAPRGAPISRPIARSRASLLERFACFEVLRDACATPWRQWPAPWRQPEPGSDRRFVNAQRRRGESGFRAFVQWTAVPPARRLPACWRASSAVDRSLSRRGGRGDPTAPTPGAIRTPSRAGFRSARRRTAQPRRTGLGPRRFHPGVLCRRMISAVPRDAALADASCRRRSPRSRSRPQPDVSCSAWQQAAAGTYVRFPLEAMLRVIAEESHRATLPRHWRGPRHRAGRLARARWPTGTCGPIA